MNENRKIYGISYASRLFSARAEPIVRQGKDCGFFDDFRCYGEKDIPEAFKARHSEAWIKPRIAGCGLWKPYIIDAALSGMKENDVLTYIDAGCTINARPKARERFNAYLRMIDESQSGFLRFALRPEGKETYREVDWTHKAMFDHFSRRFGDKPSARSTPQLISGILVMRKNAFVCEFFKKCLEIIEDDSLLLSDDYNQIGQFHRHDQSLMSLLYKSMDGDLVLPDETFGERVEERFPFLATRKRGVRLALRSRVRRYISLRLWKIFSLQAWRLRGRRRLGWDPWPWRDR